MANYEIKCINKIDRNDPTERIQRVGGYSNGSNWKITVAEAIGYIESKQHSFYVTKNGKTVWVIVAVSRYGNKYIKTEADGNEPNNLLSLPECV
jgi:hypothetical protein